jgi:AraC-like DNA-binding protein
LALQSHLLDAYGCSRQRGTRCPPKLFAMLERRAKEALDEQISSTRPIAEMAQECGLSSVAFTRAFQNATGRLPHQWAMDRRMDLGRARLLRSNDDIATVAATCGFTHPSNFSRAFVNAVGIGPAAWRRAMRMPDRGRSAVCENNRARGSILFEVSIPAIPNSCREFPWREGITLKLFAREAEPEAANNSSDVANLPRNGGPRVLLSHGRGKFESTVSVHVDPQVLVSLPLAVHVAKDILLAPHRADEDGLTHELVVALIECCRDVTSRDTRSTGHLAMALCARLARLHSGLRPLAVIDPERSGQGLAMWQLRQALDAVNARLDSGLSLSYLAATCGLSVGHFATAFARSTGLPPHRWITQQRVARAMLLLRESSMSFSEIALACGFSDQSHFSRVFSAATGLPPRRWKSSSDAPDLESNR